MEAQATVLDSKIALRVPYSEELVEMCKDVGGGRWHKGSKTWRYPLSLDTCHRMRQVFGSRLEVAEPLRVWYREANAMADQRSQASTVADATLTRLPEIAPKLASTLRADQRVTAAWLAQGWRGAGLLADHPGTGKTLGTLAGVLENGTEGPILVVCPRLSVKSVWVRELARWTNEPVYMARGTRAKRQQAIEAFKADPASRKWLVIVAETLRIQEEINDEGKMAFSGFEYPELFNIEWAVVAVDESHKMFGSLTVVKGNLAGKGLKRLKIKSGEGLHRLAITGTPFGKGGRIQGMFGTLHWLWPDEYTSFWRWAETHFEIENETIGFDRRARRPKVAKKIGRLKGGVDAEHFLRTLGPRILRRTKAEVLPNLPQKRYVDVWCEMTPAQRKQQQMLIKDAEVVGKNGFVTVDGVLAYITRAKQVASGTVDVHDGVVSFDPDESCKINMLLEKMEDRGVLDGSGDTKIIIASQFNELLKAVEERLDRESVKYLKITGSVSDRNRDEAMEIFQSDQMHTRVMILNSKAGGVSVTLDAADDLHMLDEMWDPGDNEQLEDRVHRASRIHQATILRYRTEETIDEGIGNDVEGRRFEQYRVLDQARDVTYVRAMMERAAK